VVAELEILVEQELLILVVVEVVQEDQIQVVVLAAQE